jgi:pimeloyl-ACP methyl ester carboxylesterase
MRPELAFLPHRLRRTLVSAQLSGLFHDTDAIDPYVSDVVVDEFQRTYASAGARFAFLSAARNIYLDKPFGKHGFYSRLADLERPALFVWGSHDTVIPPGFKRHVAEWLPRAEQIVIEGCGHVPQVERPDQTNGLIRRFLAREDALGAARRTRQAA